MAESTLPKSLGWLKVLRGPLTKLDINYHQFTLIVATKMTLANRTTATLLGQPQRRPRLGRARPPLLNTFLVNLLIGVLIGLAMLLPGTLLTQLALLFSTLFVMLFLTMLTSYASLLLDPHDRPIFTVRGVADRTLNAAKLTIVGAFLLVTMAAMTLPAAIVLGLHTNPLVSAAVVVAGLLLALFSLVLAMFMYMLVLHYFNGEKLKNILNVVQIVMVIGLFVASQLPNLLGDDVLAHLNFGLSLRLMWWEFIAVPVWFAGLPLLAHGAIGTVSLLFTALSCGVTGVLLVAYLHNAGRFEQLLEKLDQSSDRVVKPSWWFKFTRRLATRSRETSAYYTLGWRQLQSQRDYKLRIYPQLAYALLIPIVAGAGLLRESHGMLTHLISYLGVFLMIAAPLAILSLKYSTQPDAMTIFSYVPFAHHGQIRQSVLLAMYMRLFLPFLLVFLVAGIPFMGWHAVTAGLSVIFLNLALVLILGKLILHGLPFSEAFAATQGTKAGMINLVAVFAGMVIGFLYAFAGAAIYSYWFDLVVLLVASLVSWLLILSNRFAAA